MYCRHCGKEIADEAFMCPNCGAPTGTQKTITEQPTKEETTKHGVNIKGLSVAAFVLALFAFVTGVVFGVLFYTENQSPILLLVINASTILPALAGLTVSVYTLMVGNDSDATSKSFSITSIVLSGVVLLFLFISACILVTRH